MAQIVDGLEHNNHHDSGAVGVGNNATWTVEGILGIHFGNYQGYIVAHTECTRVVDHHGTILGDGFGKLLRGAAACRCKGDVDVFEIVVMLKQFDGQFFSTKCVSGTCTAL